MAFRYLEHTADVALEVTAPTLPALFRDALRGMADVITDVERIGAVSERRVELEADQLDLLLMEFLSEALYRFDADGELFSRVSVAVSEVSDGWTLRGRIAGEAIDADRHPMKVMIKAVTYHQLTVDKLDGGWRAHLVFDI